MFYQAPFLDFFSECIPDINLNYIRIVPSDFSSCFGTVKKKPSLFDLIEFVSVVLREDICPQLCFLFCTTPRSDSPTRKVTAQAEHSDPKGH